MKTKLAMLLALFIIFSISGQKLIPIDGQISIPFWEGTSGTFSTIYRTGNVSIGTAISDGNLTVYKSDIPKIVLKNSIGSLEIARAGWQGAFHSKATPGTTVLRTLGQSHNMILSMPNNNNDGGSFIRLADELNNKTFIVYNNGKITMGTENYDNENYNLYVKNGIKTEKVKVEIASVGGWADYVFEEGYYLRPLEEVSDYIKKYNHLPDVLSAEEAVKNGVELKSMNVLLLKKIEELTLYTINQQELLNKMQKEIDELKNK